MDRDKVRAIDAFIRRAPWMDFEFAEYSAGVVSIVGSIDPSTGDEIELLFRDASFVSLPAVWRTNTAKTVLSIVDGGAPFQVYHAFYPEQENTFFELAPEDLTGTRCLIWARDVELRVLQETWWTKLAGSVAPR